MLKAASIQAGRRVYVALEASGMLPHDTRTDTL